MDNRRFLLAILLMIAVVVITNLLFPPAAPPPRDVAPDTAAAAVDTAAPPTPGVAPAEPPAVVTADTIFVESPLYRYGFSTAGGALVSAELLQFESFTRDGPVQLVPPEWPALLSYALRGPDLAVDLSQLRFQAEPAGRIRLEPGDPPQTLTLTHVDSAGGRIELRYTFEPSSYLVRVDGQVSGFAEPPRTVLLELGPTLAVNEASANEDYRNLAYVVNSTADGIKSVRLDDVDEQRVEDGPFYWVALKNKYFLVAALARSAEPSNLLGGLIAEPVRDAHAADLTATMPVSGGQTFGYDLYIGPQDYQVLAAIGRDLEDVNPYGWRVLQPIIRPLAHLITWALVGMHEVLGIGYGWVLILFGVLMRIVLWPLNARAMRSQLKTMELQPRLREIQEKYRDNPQKLQEAMARLMREEGFNPFGGCLPMLIPFPVLITLFFVFQGTIEFRGVSFLWLPDLSRPDPYYILPIVLGASMVLLQKIGQAGLPPNPQAKMMTWFMPVFMVIIFLPLASGLNLYYAASNFATIPQQVMLNRERRRRQAAMGGGGAARAGASP